jgi:hypothetical protein
MHAQYHNDLAIIWHISSPRRHFSRLAYNSNDASDRQAIKTILLLIFAVPLMGAHAIRRTPMASYRKAFGFTGNLIADRHSL